MNCTHQNTRLVLTPEFMHYGKFICADCGKFLNWAKHPETIKREARHAQLLVRLRSDERLKAHERAFIQSLDGQGPKTTPPQRAWLESLAAKYA